MKLAEYDALIARLEESAQIAPAWYRARVVLIAGLGFAVVLLALGLGLLLIGVGGFLIFGQFELRHANAGLIKLAFVLAIFGGALAWAVVRGIWVRFPPAEGVVLRREEAPELFDEVERLRLAAGAPPVHRIVISPQLNAALYQRPRLGIFGWYQNNLVLGLPLLRQLDVAQARSVIAHELGHLQGRHGRFGAWIHRLRNTWGQVAQSTNGWKPVQWFLQWYAPLFNAYSFVLARMQEREADRAAAMAGGAEAAGTALLRVEVLARQAGRFWSDLSRRPSRQAEPPVALQLELDRALAIPPEGKRWLQEALNRPNTRRDEHPCLRERLQIIGCPALLRMPDPPPVPPSGGAAQAWLRANAETIGHRLDATWRSAVAGDWQRQHLHGKAMLVRRDALQAQAATTAGLNLDERWELCVLHHDLDGVEAALPQLQLLLAAKSDHAGALFMIGRHMLAEGDGRGVALLEKAMAADPGAVGPACELIRDFAEAQGQGSLASQVEERGEIRAATEAKAEAERAKLPAPKRLRPHGLTAAELAPLRELFAAQADIGWVAIAAVEVDHCPERRHFLVAVGIVVPWWKPRSADADQNLINLIAQRVVLPGTSLIIPNRGPNGRLAKKVDKIAEARVYDRAA